MEENKIEHFRAKVVRSKRLLRKYHVYKFLYRSDSVYSKLYHIISFLLLFFCLFVSVYPDPDGYFNTFHLLKILELVVLVWFSLEFIANFWASDCQPQYQGVRGKLKFLVKPTHLVDLIIIVLSLVIAVTLDHEDYEVFAFQSIRGLNRLLQVLQMLTFHRQLHPWRMLLSVLYHQRRQIILLAYIELILIASMAYFIYVLERTTNDKLNDYIEAFWWGVETLSTTGYGEKYPKTAIGRIVCGIYIMLSVAVFALQGTIIGVGWALKVEENERDKMVKTKRNMAASVIQNAWKCYWETQIYEALKNTFGYLDTLNSLLKERLNEQTLQLFFALLKFHMAKAKLCKLRHPMELKNIIEAQHFEQTVIKLKMKQIADKISKVMAKIEAFEVDEFDDEQLASKFFNLKQLHTGVEHCPVCCEQIRKQQQRAKKANKTLADLPEDVYTTITSIMSESSVNASPILLRRLFREMPFIQNENQTEESVPRKNSLSNRLRRRFSQWIQRK